MSWINHQKILIFLLLSTFFSFLHSGATACESFSEIQAKICEGQSYNFDSQELYESGIYHDTLLNSNGCDSIVTLELTVISPVITQLSPQICEGQSFTVGTRHYSLSGMYRDTLFSAQGCDSIVATQLSVIEAKRTNVHAAICEGEIYTVGSSSYTVSGTYRDTLTGVQGCDSIVILNLQVYPSVNTSLNVFICEGESYQLGDMNLETTGTYIYTFRSALECDSIVTVNLTVNQPSSSGIYLTICEGKTVTIGTSVYSTEGIYTDVLINNAGCDSIVTTHLTVHPVKRTLLKPVICKGQSFSVGTKVYTATGTYRDTLVSVQSCDSIITTELTVTDVYQVTLDERLCAGEIYVWNGVSYTQPGTYKDTLISQAGCDSVVTVNLIFLSIPVKNITASVCAGASYTVGSSIYTSTGVYADTLMSDAGCDSIVLLQLTVKAPVVRNINATICQGRVFLLGNNSYSTTGSYSAVLKAADGCDSTVNLQLTVEPVFAVTLRPVICRGQVFSVGNKSYATAGTYLDTLTNRFFCDSIITTVLTVKEPTFEQIMRTVCQGQSVIVGQNTYYQAGLYRDTLTSVSGCDSIIVLRLFVQNQLTSQQTVNICSGKTYTIGNSTYSASGTYRDTLASSGGCDSIVTTHLNVRPVYQQSVNRTICDGDSIIFGSDVIKSAGQYTRTFSSIYSCDSIVQLNVTVSRKDSRVENRNSCQGEVIRISNVNYSKDTTFTLKYTNILGCDSIIEYRLKFHPVYQIDAQRNVCKGTLFQNTLIEKDTSIILKLRSVYGCDSTVTVAVTAINKLITERNTEICKGEVYQGVEIMNDTILTRVLTSSQGCDSIVVDTVYALSAIVMNVSADTTINPGNPVTLFASGALSYEWSTGSVSATIVVRPYETTVYTVTGTSANGCKTEEDITVSVNSCLVSAPTYFTPNGDGNHDKWQLKGTECLSGFSLKVINRWGEVVFETEASLGSWDGTFKGKPVPEGVYFYVLEGRSIQDSKVISENGYIHLSR